MRYLLSPNFDRRGFTLIELLVVVCILGICAAVTIAHVGTQGDLVVAAAARSVMADWTYAQTRAMSLHKKTFIQQLGNQYTLLSRDTATSALTILTNPISHDAYTVAMGTGTGPMSRVGLSSWNFGGSTIVGFDELGCPFTYDASSNTCTAMTTSGSLTLGSDGTQISITLQPFTGDLTTN